MANILVIDDRPDIRLSLVLLLEDNGHHVIEADNPKVAQLIVKEKHIDLMLVDMNCRLDTTSGEEGLSFLAWLKATNNTISTIAMTAWSNTDLVVKAMKLGANDFIEKPWRNKQLLHTVEQQLAFKQLKNENIKFKQQLNDDESPQYQWISPCMKQLYKKVEAVAQADVNILLTGNNGTGKSELAQFIHQQSTRASESFIAVNMGAISESLFESEMFGHEEGAFIDAKSRRLGRFDLAEKGTLFLDEIANIPVSQQTKLLRVLESNEYEPVGSSHTRKANIRVVSATNGEFSSLIKEKLFREDLLFRLNTIEFHMPTLSECEEDIIPLAHFFLKKFSVKYQRNISEIAPCAQQCLTAYHWPGNVTEMSHLIERAVLLSESKTLLSADLALNVVREYEQLIEKTVKIEKVSSELPLMTLAEAEEKMVKRALEQTDGHVPKAAILLGLTKASMYRRLEKYGLSKK